MGCRVRNSNKKVRIRIDTGAKCNALTLHSYQLLTHTGELQSSGIVLHSYSNHQLKPVIAVSLEINSSKSKTNALFEIFDIAQQNVLSGTSAKALGRGVKLSREIAINYLHAYLAFFFLVLFFNRLIYFLISNFTVSVCE